MAEGDYKILELVENVGGKIVVEEFCEGIRHYWQGVRTDRDLLRALAERYFLKRVPCAFARPSIGERFTFLKELIREFKVDGVIWYELMYRDSYDIESYYFDEVLKKELNIPMLKIESDYDPLEKASFLTRVETFVETIRRK